MHEKQDYIMMQIEQLARVLGKILADILGLKSGNVSGAYEILSETMKTELDTNLDQLIFMNENEFKEYIRDCLFKSANLYNQLALLLAEAAKDKINLEIKLNLYKKALILYNMDLYETKIFSLSKQKQISQLERIIQDLNSKL